MLDLPAILEETSNVTLEPVTISTSPGRSLLLMRSRLETLSQAEQRVARCILDEPAEAIRSSITELAERAGVGEATVSRFCRRLGLSGFLDLKISIASELSPAELVSETDGVEDSGLPRWLRASSERSADMIERTALLVDPESLDRAIRALTKARKIDIYGQGASAITALDAQHGFIRLGMIAQAPLDTHTQAMSASLLGRGDVSLAFSHSGSTRDIVGNQQLAHDNGAETICVTSAARSPIVASSSIVLLTASEDTLVSNLRSKMVQLFVLELLIQGCARELGTAARVALERTTASVVGKMF
jgi:RpiR family carbohydrate utilization transcriptional regulator